MNERQKRSLCGNALGAEAARSRAEVLFVDFVFTQKYTRGTASIEGRLPGLDTLAWPLILEPADLDI
jgi:hypothetical protein